MIGVDWSYPALAKLVPGVNDLATLYPEVAKEADGWDPATVTAGSKKKLQWRCDKGHTWEGQVNNRTPPQSSGCPVCSGNRVESGFNDLATHHPEIAKEADGWNPSTVTAGSNKKLGWRCAKGHTWEATVGSRTPPISSGCPVCAGKAVLPGFNDLATLCPEVAAEADGWDPRTVSTGSGKRLRWRCKEGHTWEAKVTSRTPPQSNSCPVCSGRQLFPGFNDLATLWPQVAQQADGWDPKTVTAGSSKKLTWRCREGHTWNAQVKDRTPPESNGCPVCSGRQVFIGFNDLATLVPHLAEEADGWEPSRVTIKSGQKKSWRCAKGHTWEATVASRTPPESSGCPFCAGKKASSGFNDLATLFPGLAAEADGWDPTEVTTGSNKKLRWRCSKGHTYLSTVGSRTPPRNTGCPVCAGRQVLTGFNDLLSCLPEVAAEAEGWDPRTVTTGSQRKSLWRCKEGHTWTAAVCTRTPPQSSGCPVCAGRQVLKGFNDLLSLFPEVAKEAYGWDPTTVTAKSSQKKAWRCDKGHTWECHVSHRTPPVSSGCPTCADYGFKPGEPAWFYLLQRPGEQQLGVTNNKTTRLRQHAVNGWVEVEVVGPFPGHRVLAMEKKLKKWLRREVGLVPGTHENWFTARLEVNSLAELKAVSGVETDLF